MILCIIPLNWSFSFGVSSDVPFQSAASIDFCLLVHTYMPFTCCKLQDLVHSLSLRCTRTIKNGSGNFNILSLLGVMFFLYDSRSKHCSYKSNSSLTMNACIRFLGLPICFKRPLIILNTTQVYRDLVPVLLLVNTSSSCTSWSRFGSGLAGSAFTGTINEPLSGGWNQNRTGT